MASTRAQEVAEVLWELKRAGKVATYSSIARRAGFSAGSKGRTMQTCLRTVRRDWPHLQWWRALSDDGLLEKSSEQVEKLREAGFDLEDPGESEAEDVVALAALDEVLMDWENEGGSGEPETSSTTPADG